MVGPTVVSEATGVKLNARFPEILKKRMDGYVAKRRVEAPKYSLNDLIVEAVRGKLDGPVIKAQTMHFPGGGVARIPEVVQLGEFKEGFWEKWGRESKRLEGDTREESFREALMERVGGGLELPKGFARMSVVAKMAWLRVNDA